MKEDLFHHPLDLEDALRRREDYNLSSGGRPEEDDARMAQGICNKLTSLDIKLVLARLARNEVSMQDPSLLIDLSFIPSFSIISFLRTVSES
jgi:hypothetical protein